LAGSQRPGIGHARVQVERHAACQQVQLDAQQAHRLAFLDLGHR
jgi:hypothetical protein